MNTYCKACGGEGYTEAMAEAALDTEDDGLHTPDGKCPVCDGTGEVEETRKARLAAAPESGHRAARR